MLWEIAEMGKIVNFHTILQIKPKENRFGNQDKIRMVIFREIFKKITKISLIFRRVGDQDFRINFKEISSRIIKEDSRRIMGIITIGINRVIRGIIFQEINRIIEDKLEVFRIKILTLRKDKILINWT